MLSGLPYTATGRARGSRLGPFAPQRSYPLPLMSADLFPPAMNRARQSLGLSHDPQTNLQLLWQPEIMDGTGRYRPANPLIFKKKNWGR